MKPNDFVSEFKTTELQHKFSTALKMKIGTKYVMVDIFANTNPLLCGNEIANVINNLRKLCDVIEAQYE